MVESAVDIDLTGSRVAGFVSGGTEDEGVLLSSAIFLDLFKRGREKQQRRANKTTTTNTTKKYFSLLTHGYNFGTLVGILDGLSTIQEQSKK